MAEVESLKARARRRQREAKRRCAERCDELLAALPNLPAPDVPVGADEHGNVEVRR